MSTTIVVIWWLLFATAVGLCIGSFLNAVIYRLPRHGSLRTPTWSACPHCGFRINWYDNIPILSFIILRGKCRKCSIPIATRYVVVEAGMAIIVLMLMDAFFFGAVRQGVGVGGFGLTDQLASDWPILVAHIILFACLFSMSVIDLEHYWVDIRFTHAATVAGFVLHMFWSPRHGEAWFRPADTTAVVTVLAFVGLAAVWIASICRAPEPDPLMDGQAAPIPDAEVSPPAKPFHHNKFKPPSRGFAWASTLLLVFLLVELVFASTKTFSMIHFPRGLFPILLFFLMIVWESTVVRKADQEIVETIEEERSTARATALRELMMLAPAIALAAVGFIIMSGDGELPRRVAAALDSHVSLPGVPWMRHWSPLMGFATAATGFVIAGGIGWAVRIIFTLILGKEAFGIGDIHLMAAAGCVAGWPVVVLGFFLATFLALASWILVLPFKRARALPLGPWLTLGFLCVTVLYEPIIHTQTIQRILIVADMLFFGNSQAVVVETGG